MAEPVTPPDEVLLARIAAGDAESLAALFHRHQRTVYRFALHLTGSPAAADDVTQDVFIAVIRDAARFDPQRASATAWLCGIARNYVRRRLASNDGQDCLDDEQLEALPAVDPDPLGDLTRAEQLDALQRALVSLPLRYREVVVLCDLQEVSYADAATAIGCAVGTVRSRLHRGRALLAAKMQAQQRTTVEGRLKPAPTAISSTATHSVGAGFSRHGRSRTRIA